MLAWVPGLLLLAWSAETLRRLLPAYDRAFYATNAFYSEIFRRAGGVRVADREPIPYRAVYWAPRRWKPSVWASLLQLDRKLPLGRFIALGHVALWLLFFRDAAPDTIAVYLVLFIAAKNGASYLLVTRPIRSVPVPGDAPAALGLGSDALFCEPALDAAVSVEPACRCPARPCPWLCRGAALGRARPRFCFADRVDLYLWH